MENMIVENWLDIFSRSDYKNAVDWDCGSGYGPGACEDDGTSGTIHCGYLDDVAEWCCGHGNEFGCGGNELFRHRYSNGIKIFNGSHAHMIDGKGIIIEKISGDTAEGFILEIDFTLTPCFILKDGTHIVCCKSLYDGRKLLKNRVFYHMDCDEVIDEFINIFEPYKKYNANDFYEWHFYLTKSSWIERDEIMKKHDINFETELTVDDFINISRDECYCEIIERLEKKWAEVKRKK